MLKHTLGKHDFGWQGESSRPASSALSLSRQIPRMIALRTVYCISRWYLAFSVGQSLISKSLLHPLIRGEIWIWSEDTARSTQPSMCRFNGTLAEEGSCALLPNVLRAPSRVSCQQIDGHSFRLAWLLRRLHVSKYLRQQPVIISKLSSNEEN